MHDVTRTLVGTRVLEQNDLALLEEQPRLLRDEQVRAFDDPLEVRLALRVHERRLGNEQVVIQLLLAQVGDEQTEFPQGQRADR